MWKLFRYGGLTKLASRKFSVAAKAHDQNLRREAKQALHYPPVALSDRQAALVVDGFAETCDESGYRIHACAVLPDHIHLVIGAHRREIRPPVGHLKSKATSKLRESGLWFPVDRPVWGEHGWNVYLDDLAEVTRAIAYVDHNPEKEGRPSQHWPPVTPFDPRMVVSRAVNIVKRRKIGGAALRSHEAKQNRQQ